MAGSALALGAGKPLAAQEAPRSLILAAESGPKMQAVSNHLRPGFSLTADAATPLRVKMGEKLTLKFRNGLEEAVGLQIRGLRLPQTATLSAVNKKSSVEVPLQFNESGTYLLQATDTNQIARGLSTLLVVEEATPPQVHLELPFLVQDWDTIALPILSLNGVTRETERAISTTTVRPNSRVRLRIANGTASRGFLMTFGGMVPYIVAIDSTPSEMFRPRQDAFPFGPGARYDVMFDVPAGSSPLISVDNGKNKQELMRFRTEGEPREALPAIAPLPVNPSLPPEIELARAQRFECVFGAANALRSFDLKRDTPTSLALINKSGGILSVHLGGQIARVLHPADDGWEPYWRDSLIMAVGQTVHVALLPRVTGRFFLEGIKLDTFEQPDRLTLNVV